MAAVSKIRRSVLPFGVMIYKWRVWICSNKYIFFAAKPPKKPQNNKG